MKTNNLLSCKCLYKTLLYLFFFFITTNIQAQSVSINKQNATLADIFEEVENQTKLSVAYSESTLDKNRRTSVDINNKPVEQAMEEILKDTGVTFTLQGKQILIRPVSVAQQEERRILTGLIKDEFGDPVIGANVVEKGTTNGTITDVNGKYSLEVGPGATLVVSYIGYTTTELSVGKKNVLNVVLREDSKALDEVVVVGYGTQRKGDLTGAIASIKMEELAGDRPVTNVFSALQGSIPGLQITRKSTPGQNDNTINIRGTLSVNGGSPLILIDNVPGDLGMLNPEDIESVSVLKDAASAAIYGARAAGGVILVTTKRPAKETKFSLNYNNSIGFEKSINRPEQASLDQYFQAYQDAGFSNTYWASGQDVSKWREYVRQYKANPSAFNTVGDGIYQGEDGKIYYLNEKDLASNIMETGFMQNHNLSVSGGTEKIRYRVAAGYNFEDGPMITSKDKFSRKNISGFISADVTGWFTQELDIRYSQSDKHYPKSPNGGGYYDTRLISYYPEGNMPGEFINSPVDLPTITPRNLIYLSNTERTVVDNPRIFVKSIFKPFKGLEAVFEYTFNKNNNRYEYYTGQVETTSIQLDKSTYPKFDKYTKNREYTDYNALNAYLTYDRSFGSHNLKVMGGFDQESSHFEKLNTSGEQQAVQSVPSLGGATDKITVLDGYSVFTIRSLFFRLNYNYKNKYLLSVNGRYDGSSKFPKNNRFGFFPSFSAGWQVGEEKFMEFSRFWLDGLKLRASWGKIGNQAIDPYQYTPSMAISTSGDNSNFWMENGNYVTTIGLPALVSSTFTWEKVTTTDIGLDLTLLNNRLTGTFDWYQRDTKGMLAAAAQPLPAVVGSSAPTQNTANMTTKGWEFSVNWADKIGEVGYRVGFNIYDHKSKITKYDSKGLFYDRNEAQDEKRYRTDMEIGEIWGYVTDGYYTVDDFVDTKNWILKDGVTTINGVNPRPGDLKFKNLRDDASSTNRIDGGDNTVDNPGDRKVIGNSTPRFQYGANLGVNYAGFDLSVLLQGVGKRDVWLGDAAIFPFGGASTNDAIFRPVYYNQLDYWQPVDAENGDYTAVNPNAKYFRIYDQMQNSGSNTRISDKYLQKASYLRIKNVTLSYSLPKAWLKPILMEQLRLYVSIENLATISSLPKGYDPETVNWSYPFYRTTSFGLSVTF